MGYLTTITIHNDALGTFRKHPKEFAEALFEGIDEAYRNRGVTSVSFHGYANYIEVQPSRHADDFTVYVHAGNEVTNLNNYDDSFKKFAKSNPELAESYVDQAIAHLKRLKKDIKNESRIHL